MDRSRLPAPTSKLQEEHVNTTHPRKALGIPGRSNCGVINLNTQKHPVLLFYNKKPHPCGFSLLFIFPETVAGSA